ncbi:nitrate ABC transporter substrate-binding protein [Chelatococcus sambhunathii]|uniref:Nitrate ABC transporter substrate-binding protein n=1 Tax=Chelatococcus sambhunathii TaxID=363953 RepID=A0ABU1DC31_9HYPH|nr:nitrate ABC transporter substrate-binding protein [Chelatococcus sambhunathii]MDR4305480.1 nitrate ABC transporter substrate-binding protein [Chelatococcus sambhunathii]
MARLSAITFAAAGILAASAIPTTVKAEVNFGKQGEKVDLVVGYQPYYAASWSGVVNNGKGFWKKHLPEGSTASFQIGLQGAVIVNAMTGEKQHIGYAGDMPSIAATFRNLRDRGGTDIRIVASIGLSQQQCNIFMVKNDAPNFASGEEAVKWMAGKQTAAPQGACADRFAREAFDHLGVKPASYLNQNVEVITTNFRAGKLDAATVWEPTASKIEMTGIARRVATGLDFKQDDGAFLLMLNDLIKQRPDVVKGWLESEIDSQLFMADMKNADEVARLAESQTERMDRKILWSALYGAMNEKDVGSTKLEFDFVVTDRVRKLLDGATQFLNTMPAKPAAEPKIRADGVDDSIAKQIMAERGLTSPIGVIKAQSATDFKN